MIKWTQRPCAWLLSRPPRPPLERSAVGGLTPGPVIGTPTPRAARRGQFIARSNRQRPTPMRSASGSCLAAQITPVNSPPNVLNRGRQWRLRRYWARTELGRVVLPSWSRGNGGGVWLRSSPAPKILRREGHLPWTKPPRSVGHSSDQPQNRLRRAKSVPVTS